MGCGVDTAKPKAVSKRSHHALGEAPNTVLYPGPRPVEPPGARHQASRVPKQLEKLRWASVCGVGSSVNSDGSLTPHFRCLPQLDLLLFHVSTYLASPPSTSLGAALSCREQLLACPHSAVEGPPSVHALGIEKPLAPLVFPCSCRTWGGASADGYGGCP